MNEAVNLTNCDREPIHIPGSVQSFGFLLTLLSDFTICMASDNVGSFLGADVSDLLQQPLSRVISEAAVETIRSRVDHLSGPDATERLFGVELQAGKPPYDLSIHFSGAYLVVEAESSVNEPGVNSGELVRLMLERIRKTRGMTELAREAARQLKVLTGFDRVMVYQFHPDGSGEVIAEAAEAGLERFLGLHYPASDIPRQARILYQRNWLRIIADIDAQPAALVSTATHNAGLLDLSMSVLRSVSPIHIEYLRNMGVGASMSVSILRDGKLWGLFACHHYSPRYISFEKRTASELFGQMFSWIVEGREREGDVAYEARAHHVQERLIDTAASHEHSRRAIVDFLGDYRNMIECDGVAVWSDNRIVLQGETPTEDEVKELVSFINRTSPGRIFASAEIAKVYAAGQSFRDRAAGFLAIPISRAPRDCLIFFRREVTRSVHWAGDPNKVYDQGPNGPRLTPRRSFELWQETVAGQSKPWSAADIRIAESLRVTLLEVILQLSDLAARERRGAQERQELMIAELNHRVRNILSLVRALVAQSKDTATTVEEFAGVLGGRIQALARAHDQITNLNWAPVALRSLLESEAGAYLGARADRVKMGGPDVALDPKAFATLALVVHEMMTNSAKYGARRFHRQHRGGVAARSVVEPRDRLEGDRRSAGAAAVAPRLRDHDHRALRAVRPQGRSRNPVRPAGGASNVRHSPQLRRTRPIHRGSRHANRRTAILASQDFRHGADRRGQPHHRHGRRGHPARSRRPPCRYRRKRRSGAAGDRAHAPGLCLARSQPRQREQHKGGAEADGNRRALHVRDRLWRAGADPNGAGRRACDPEALHAGSGRKRARQIAAGRQLTDRHPDKLQRPARRCGLRAKPLLTCR